MTQAKRAQLNRELDEIVRAHDGLIEKLGRVGATAVLVAAGRLLLLDLDLRDRVKVERMVEYLLP